MMKLDPGPSFYPYLRSSVYTMLYPRTKRMAAEAWAFTYVYTLGSQYWVQVPILWIIMMHECIATWFSARLCLYDTLHLLRVSWLEWATYCFVRHFYGGHCSLQGRMQLVEIARRRKKHIYSTAYYLLLHTNVVFDPGLWQIMIRSPVRISSGNHANTYKNPHIASMLSSVPYSCLLLLYHFI